MIPTSPGREGQGGGGRGQGDGGGGGRAEGAGGRAAGGGDGDCGICLGRAGGWIDHGDGFFGDHSRGVNASKHADCTFFCQQDRDVKVGDEGEVLVLELVTGHVKRFEGREDGFDQY